MNQAIWYRHIEETPLPGPINMAMDQYFLQLIEEGRLDRPILRTYRWARPTLSLGYHQQWEKVVDLKALEQHGVDLVRRWTGGRAVLHDREITYALIAPMTDPFRKRVRHNYCIIGKALNRFASFADLPTALAAGSSPGSARSQRFAPCFASLSDAEIESVGKKLIGSSQKLGKNAFLQHGSIPLENQIDLLQKVTGTELDMAEYMVTFGDLCQKAGMALPSREALLGRLVSGFATEFNVHFEDVRSLGLPDMEAVAAIAAESFEKDEWTFRR